LIFIPPYGSMRGYLVYHVFGILFVCFFLCTVTDISAAEKYRGVKFCMHVDLSRHMSPFGEHWLAGSHGGGGITGMSHFFLAHEHDTEVCG